MPVITRRGKEADELRFQELQLEDPPEDNLEVDNPQTENRQDREKSRGLEEDNGDESDDEYHTEDIEGPNPETRKVEEPPTRVVYLKEPTLNNLENLDKKKVERFLQEAKSFLRYDPTFRIEERIFGDARTILSTKTNLRSNKEIIAYLKKYLAKITGYGRTEPYRIIEEKLRWPKKKNSTLEEQLEEFFNKLSIYITEAGEAASKKTIKKKIAKLAVKRIPKDFLIEVEDLEVNPSLYDLDTLKDLCMERIVMVRKQRRLNRKDNEELRYVELSQNEYERDIIEEEEVRQVGEFQQPTTKRPMRNNAPAREQGGLTCWNCGGKGHAVKDCEYPVNYRAIEENREIFYRNRRGQKPSGREFGRNRQQHFKNRRDNEDGREKKFPIRADHRVARLKFDKAAYAEVQIQVFDQARGKYLEVPGVLDSGTTSNVAPMKLYRYITEDIKLSKETKFRTPTGDTIIAEKIGKLNLRLSSPSGSRDLGGIICFFVGGNWTELLIGERTLQWFGLSPNQQFVKQMRKKNDEAKIDRLQRHN